jgi:hypothetical protein
MNVPVGLQETIKAFLARCHACGTRKVESPFMLRRNIQFWAVILMKFAAAAEPLGS